MLYSDEPDFQLADSLSVLRRDIPWDIYQTARLISDRDLQLLRRFDKKEGAYQAKLLEEVGAGLVLVGTCGCWPASRGGRGASIAIAHRWVCAAVRPAPPDTRRIPPRLPHPPQSGPAYVEAFLTVLKNVTKDETVQYVLALVEQLLAGEAACRLAAGVRGDAAG